MTHSILRHFAFRIVVCKTEKEVLTWTEQENTVATEEVDVVIVGAGLAGVTAARELGYAGLKVKVLEARDRVGGRIWTINEFGKKIELGGNWLHWLQPHVWAEVTRYGLVADRNTKPVETYWLSNGEVQKADLPGFMDMIDPGMERLVGDSAKYMPRPDQVTQTEEYAELDKLTLQEALDALNLDDLEKDANEAAWVGHCNAPLDKVGFSAAIRWTAATAGSWHQMHEASSIYRLKNGNDQLVNAIAKDIKGEIQLNTQVENIRHDADGVEVTTGNGEVIRAKRAIVTVPLNILHELDVQPPLSEGKLEASRVTTASQGLKVWIKVKGPIEPFFAYSTQHHPLSVVRTEFTDEDSAVLVAFGADASRLDITDPKSVQEALKVWRDDLEVLEVTSHDWMNDPLARSTWMIQRPNEYTKSQAELQRPEGNVYFASSDIANIWAGFFDGAIESAMIAAREVAASLAGDKTELQAATA